MKIISKFKDYYDYLQGIYGVYPKLVLDKREFNPIQYFESFSVKHLFIGDY